MAVRCLIVDDNRSFLSAASDLLERDGISVVGVASTGTEAQRKYRELKPDIALVDVDLGEESGVDLARELAGPAKAADAEVVLISAHAQDDFTHLIAAGPALSFIGKSDLSGATIRSILADAQRGDAR
jgi:DNA-binding NarL/FixJ family response regulator